MRVIVRLLLRLAILAGAAVVIVLLAGWSGDAGADTTLPDLDGAGAPPAPQAPLPPPPADVPDPPLPSAPLPPTVTAPSPPSIPVAPDLSPVPTLLVPPGLTVGVPLPPAPSPPPDAPGVGLETITNALDQLPGAPSFTPPEATELPALPELPVPSLPSGPPEPSEPPEPSGAPGPIEVGVLSDARPSTANTSALAPTDPMPEPLNASDTGRADGGALFAAFVRDSAPARAPPMGTSQHSCPGGGGSSSGRAAPVGLVPPGADDATRRASLPFGSRAYASTSECHPLLRPD
jgi:homeobox protein ESX1